MEQDSHRVRLIKLALDGANWVVYWDRLSGPCSPIPSLITSGQTHPLRLILTSAPLTTSLLRLAGPRRRA